MRRRFEDKVTEVRQHLYTHTHALLVHVHVHYVTCVTCVTYSLLIVFTHNMQAGVAEQIAKLDKLILELKQQESSHLELLSAVLVKRK